MQINDEMIVRSGVAAINKGKTSLSRHFARPIGSDRVSCWPGSSKQLQTMTPAPKLDNYEEAEKLIHKSWAPALEPELNKDYMLTLKKKLREEQAKGVVIYPPSSLVFKALEQPVDQVRVIIVGQDPYHSPGQAEGLAFSVPHGIPIPSSLKNVYSELSKDIPDFHIPPHGSLHNWAKQGVLLLNAALTVRARSANSHKDIGWGKFTDHILRCIIKEKKDDPVVFLLWGRFAQQKGRQAGLFAAKNPNFLILEAAHPSGLSAHRGFFGCKHFSKTNNFLQKNGVKPIDWQL